MDSISAKWPKYKKGKLMSCDIFRLYAKAGNWGVNIDEDAHKGVILSLNVEDPSRAKRKAF